MVRIRKNSIKAALSRSTFLLMLFHLPVLSQENITFNHLTVEDGLSQSSVTCILQDNKGFLWFGTQDGLNRYDGYNFTVYKNNPADTTSLTDNFIFSIIESISGTLFIETQNGNLHRFNSKSESFSVVDQDSINFMSAKISTVKALLYEPEGIRWKGGLGDGTGLERIDSKTGQTTIFKHDPADPYSLSDNKVYSILRDHSGKLWIGTYGGLDRLDEKSGKFFHYRNESGNPYSLPDNWIWPLYEDSRDNLWIGTVNAGLCLFDRASGKFINYNNDPDEATSLNDNFVFSIYEDRSGLLWIGTNLGGINYFNSSTQVFKHFKHDPKNANSLSDDIVLSMLVDKTGKYWIGTRNGGLNQYDPKTKKYKHYLHISSIPNSIISNSVISLLEDRYGRLWIGSYSSGLDVYDPGSSIFKHYIHDPADPGTISDNRIYSLIEDDTGNIWIGTYGGGLNKIISKTGKIERYQHSESDPGSISSNATWSVALDESGSLWVGTFGGGINVFNRKNRTFRHFYHDANDSSSIIDDNIIRVFKDSKGDMWIGSSKGLSKYIKETSTFRNFDENDGLANSFVYGIVEDGSRNLWISTNNGLSRFDIEKETFKNFYVKDGLPGNEFNQNAFAKNNKTGEILFGGPDGYTVFHPDSLKDNTYRPPIAFTGYLRYNTNDEEGKPIIEKGISDRDSIFLTYKDNIINLEFAALSYYNNLQNHYRYKLEGFNENWIQLGTNHSVTFTNLSPGAYQLNVLGSNNDGVWNEEGTSLMIFLSPPWWKTRLAYLIYFITFFSILYGLRRFELNRREQKAQIREAALRIKATEAEKRALEIENERKAKELEAARQLQLSMLPKELPDHPDLEIAAFMRTATEVGGDYYDFMARENGVLDVAFGDATGHGLQAGTMVTLMKGFFTSEAANLDIQEFMSHCSKIIKEIKLGRILMSLTYLKIENKNLQLACGGMPPVFLYNKKKNQVDEISINGMPLGAMKNARYTTFDTNLSSGDTILLLTDGLAEQMNKKEEMFGYERIKNIFLDNINCHPDKIIEILVGEGDRWMDERNQDDDITLVILRVK